MSGTRLLIVDPDARASQALAAELAEHACQVAIAHDGAHAVTHATETVHDVALVELTLPDMTGSDLIRRLKALHAGAMHVIVVTDRADEELRADAFAAGTDDYVLEPAPPGDIVRRIHAAVRQKREVIDARLEADAANRRHVYGQEAAAMLAHDLNNGLAVVLSNVSFLNDVVQGDADVADALVATLRSVQRMSGLVANFVDIARFEDETVTPVARATNVRELLESVKDVSETTVAKGVTFEVRCAPDLEAACDAALLERVLHNLVGNATRYCPAGGRITMSADSDGDELAIRVSNTGPLVPEAIRGALFERTVRGKGRKRGMGLYFCRLAVEAHGGHITYTPNDAGPSFTVRLPARRTS